MKSTLATSANMSECLSPHRTERTTCVPDLPGTVIIVMVDIHANIHAEEALGEKRLSSWRRTWRVMMSHKKRYVSTSVQAATPDLNYFTCTLGQAAELNTVDQHSWKTINEFIDRQAQENPNRPAVGFPVPLNNKTQQSKWSFEVYSTWRPETSEFPKLTLE